MLRELTGNSAGPRAFGGIEASPAAQEVNPMAAPQQQPMPGPATLEEGGFSARHRGWLVVGAAFLSNVVAFGITYSFGVMFDGVSAEFGAGRGATAAVFSLAMALHFLLGFVAGPATDRQPASPGRGVSPALDSRRP